MASPLKPSTSSVSTSPFKINNSNITAKPSLSNIQKLIKIEEESDTDISYTPSVTHRESSPSTSLQMASSSDCSELIEEDKKQEKSKILEFTLVKIMNNPRSYIGVPKNCSYVMDFIEEELRIPANHILMCLKKLGQIALINP
ncbi:hypothetical protein WA026_017343 [Henosepilachna vigintioctopunctata]|uniref:Uncharacterized protein n=1 Tax=Henosepilachna vigintioctopunctata TaxID=420089 RepID=A0AAW1VDK9_9CUCU